MSWNMTPIDIHALHQKRLEQFAVQSWEVIQIASAFGPEVERARLLEAAECMHGARMVLTGPARADADTLCELAWTRLAALDRGMREQGEMAA